MKLKKGTPLERLINGILKENPTFVLMLGMCATLAVTTAAVNGLAMGLSTAAVLVLSNVVISAMRKIIPDGVRMPAYIVIVATLVTVVELVMHAYTTDLYNTLGIYIPLIVVNCIILGRAEAYASQNGVISSMFDGIGMGLGFTLALTVIGAVRELLGSGSIFGIQILGDWYTPVSIFVMAPGAFFVLACIAAIRNKVITKTGNIPAHSEIACGGNCRYCAGNQCAKNHDKLKSAKDTAVSEKADKGAEK